MGKTKGTTLLIKGFSLVEILVAMAILSIFIAASVPLLTGSFERVMWGGEKSEFSYRAQSEVEEGSMPEPEVPDPTGTFRITFQDEITLELEVKKIIRVIEGEFSGRSLKSSLIYYSY